MIVVPSQHKTSKDTTLKIENGKNSLNVQSNTRLIAIISLVKRFIPGLI